MKGKCGCVMSSALCVALSVQALAAPQPQTPSESHKEAQAVSGEASVVEPSLADIINKSLTAYGGKEALALIESASVLYGKQSKEESASSATAPSSTYRHVRKGVKWRTDVESEGADATKSDAPAAAAPAGTAQTLPDSNASRSPTTVSTAFDGNSGWQGEGQNQNITDLDEKKLNWMNEMETRQFPLLAHWQERDYKFELRGRTQYKQVPVFSVDVTYKEGHPSTFFIDQNNYLVVGMAYEIDSCDADAGGASKSDNIMVDYTEYRPSAGLNYPFKQAFYKNGDLLWELAANAINCGVNIDDGLFAKPNAGPVFHLAKPVTVPFDYSQKEVLVKGRINGSEELDLLVDTGASETLIDRRVAAEHYLAKQGQFDIAGVAGIVSTQSSLVKRLEVGNLVLNDLPARIVDLSPQSRMLGKQVGGIIGTNIISRFAVTFDYSKPSIVFSDPDNFQRPAKAVAVPFTQKQAPFVKVNLNGKDEQVLLVDTGAAFNHLPTVVAQRYLGGDQATLRHVTEGTGLDGRPLQLGRVVVDTVSIAGLPAHKVAFTYPYKPDAAKSKPGDRSGFFQDSRLGILGNPFWQNFIVTVDYKFQRLLLTANPLVKLRGDIDSAISQGDNSLVLHRDYRAAEAAYQRGLMIADGAHDPREQARMQGRLGNLRRIMAKDLNRPEHAKAAYNYFSKAQELAGKGKAQDVEGRILADWSLLYSDNGQTSEAKQTIDRALLLAPQDPNVNVDCAVHLYRSRLFPEMQKYVDKALFLDPSNWQALWYQVKLSENFFDTPKVVATLKEIVRYYPWSKLATEKLRSLNMLGPGKDSSKEKEPAMVLPQQNRDKTGK